MGITDNMRMLLLRLLPMLLPLLLRLLSYVLHAIPARSVSGQGFRGCKFQYVTNRLLYASQSSAFPKCRELPLLLLLLLLLRQMTLLRLLLRAASATAAAEGCDGGVWAMEAITYTLVI